jgi:tellurite resistance protein TerC
MATESEGSRFFVRRNRKLFATSILLALALIEASDVLFALDSVPAIFAITREPLIVYTSNVFAILGLLSRKSIEVNYGLRNCSSPKY